MTQTDIANLALKGIGAKSINSIDDDDFTARLIKIFMPQVIEEVSSLRDWVCLVRRKKLTRTAIKTDCGEFCFIKPVGLMKIIASIPLNDCRIEGEHILSCADENVIEGVFASMNPAEWDLNLRTAIIHKLRAEIVLPVKGDANFASQVIGLSREGITKCERQDIYNAKIAKRQQGSSWLPKS